MGDDDLLGLATLRPDGPDCELVTLARERGCRRLWLVTSNDNLDALRFYQRRGLRLVTDLEPTRRFALDSGGSNAVRMH